MGFRNSVLNSQYKTTHIKNTTLSYHELFNFLCKFRNYNELFSYQNFSQQNYRHNNSRYLLTLVTLPVYIWTKSNIRNAFTLSMEPQWNLSDTYGTEVFLRFREVSTLERFELKSYQI